MGRAERASEALLEKNFGRLSSYCICIGGEGLIAAGHHTKEKLYFHSDQSEIRFLPLGTEGKQDELVLCKINHRFDEIPLSSDERCVMAMHFTSLLKLCKEKQAKRKHNQESKETEGGSTGTEEMNYSPGAGDNVTTPTPVARKKRKRVSIANHVYSVLVSFIVIFVEQSKANNLIFVYLFPF
jgi:hypothetical protein